VAARSFELHPFDRGLYASFNKLIIALIAMILES
jgi:hypothetical protein